ncbi:MAG TPA: DUF4126 domain-containing protein [Candidatus Acidoferrales bacterium]|nr:DUF4126 domain-containing protein [Candidatus Acidoferrales bacterium]
MDPAAQYALAYALTTAAGVRGVLALAAMAIAAHTGLLHPPQHFAWLGSAAATYALVAVAILDLLADKVPLLDSAMHVAGVVVKPAAAAVLVGGAVHAQSPELLASLMALGALNALGVHAAVASLRAASTATTGGLANPAISLAEDAGSAGAVVLALAAPFAAAAAAVAFTIAIVAVARSAYRRLRRT